MACKGFCVCLMTLPHQSPREIWEQLKQTYLSHSLLCCIFSGEGNKSVTSILTRHGIHHEPKIPNCSTFFKKWNKLIFIHIFGDFPTKNLKSTKIAWKSTNHDCIVIKFSKMQWTYFTAIAWRRAFPLWWGTSILSLTSCDIKWIASPV